MTETLSDVDRLAIYRLEHDLTWDQLADEMRAAGYPVAARALHNGLTHRLRRAPTDRTLYKIRRFLELRDRQPARRRRQVTT
jgi:hypothetical protein